MDSLRSRARACPLDHFRRGRAHPARELSRLGARRFRFLHPDFRDARGRARVPSPHLAHRVHDHRDARAASGRRAHLRLDRRPLRPPHPADGRRHLLFHRRSAERPRAELTDGSCSCARCTESGWAANGAWARRSRWKRCRRDGADSSPACCRRVTRSATCSRRPRSSSSSRTSDGARCSFSAARPRC